MRRVNTDRNNNNTNIASRSAANTAETINAAANAIASTDTHALPRHSLQKKRWGSFFSIYWCFGSNKSKKRIGHAVLVPEPTGPQYNFPASQNSAQASSRSFPFVAPPSSPASFLQSETPSAMQSPAGLVPLNSVSGGMYSPGGPSSIFSIGPYAHETQLVSPPVFSTYTTEPSTAPFTPPPESVHLTTPSSPEVPIAQLLDFNLRNGEVNQKFLSAQYEFNSYQFQPGSPVGQLISPSSGISGSGTSSPYPGRDYAVSGSQFLEFWKGERSNLFSLDKMSSYDWGSRLGSGTLTPNSVRPKSSDEFPLDHPPNLLNPEELPANKFESRQVSGTLTPDAFTPKSHDEFPLDRPPVMLLDLENSSPSNCELKGSSDTYTANALRLECHDRFPLDCQTPVVASHEFSDNGSHNNQLIDHRVSFELTLDDVARCMEKKPPVTPDPILTIVDDVSATEREDNSSQIADETRCSVEKTANETPNKPLSEVEGSGQNQRHHTTSLGSGKDFNFDYSDGADSKRPIVNSDWWSSEKVAGREHEPMKKWSFFPLLQPGVT